MDAVEFVEERRRMYAVGRIKNGLNDFNTKAEDVVKEVEEWSAAHPRKTRQSEFLKQWPEARIDENTGVLTICPAELTKEYRDVKGVCGAHLIETCVCKPCRRKFWMQEVE